MDALFILLPVAMTSVGAYLLGRTGLRLDDRTLVRAVVRMVECLGIWAAFFLINTLVGMALVLVLRGTAFGFLSLYMVSDLVLLPLSLAQGLVFWWWRTGA